MEDNQKISPIPELSLEHTPPSKSTSPIFDSLRFSQCMDRDSTLSYSEDGRDIEFEFEDYPHQLEYSFKFDDKNETMENNSATRKLQIFQKYKKNNEEQKNGGHDIIQSFDKIFKFRGENGDSNPTKFMFKKKAHNEQDTASLTTQNTNKDKVTQQDKKPQQTIQQKQQQRKKSVQNNPGFILKQSPQVAKEQKSGALLNNISETISVDMDLKERLDIGISNNTSSSRNSYDPFNLNYLGSDKTIEMGNKTNIALINDLNISNSNKPASSNPSNTALSNSLTNSSKSIDSNLSDSRNLYKENSAQIIKNTPDNAERPKIPTKDSFIQKIDLQASKSSQSIKIQPYIYGGSNKSIPSTPKINISYSVPQKVIPQQPNENLNKSVSFTGPTTPRVNTQPNLRSFDSLNMNNGNQKHENRANKIMSIQNQISNANMMPQTLTGGANKKIPPIVFMDNKLSSSQQLTHRLASPLFDQQNRIAPFLRKIRKMNSIYPNFNHPTINLENQAKFCNLLANIFEQALIYLSDMTYRIFERVKISKIYPSQLLNYNYFLKSGWQVLRQKQWEMINNGLKPRTNFAKSQIDEQKILKALQNYHEVISYYKTKKIDLNNEHGISTYFRIRQKFWNLQKNMRSISQDIYQFYAGADYPPFFYDYLNVLKTQIKSIGDISTIKYHQHVLNVVITNQQRQQPLSCSQVGIRVRAHIEKELKRLYPC